MAARRPSDEPSNIYAPPAEDRELPLAVRAHGEGVWRERGLAVVERSGAVFPERCVVCNVPGGERLHLTLRWHPEWIYAFTVAGVLPYVILALALGKTAPVELSLCHTHASRRRTGLWAGFLGTPVSIGIMALAIWADSVGLLYLGMGGAITGLLLGLLWGRVIHVGRMDDRYVSLAAGPPFLNSLPSHDSWSQGAYARHPPEQWGSPGQWATPPRDGSAEQWGSPGQWATPPRDGSAEQWGAPGHGGAQPPGSTAEQWGALAERDSRGRRDPSD